MKIVDFAFLKIVFVTIVMLLFYHADAPASVSKRSIVDDKVYKRLSNQSVKEIHVIVNLKTESIAALSKKERRDKIFSTQTRVLSNLPAKEFRVAHKYRNIPAFTTFITADGLDALAADQNVISIGLDARVKVSLDDSVPFIRADVVHEVYGYTGQGITVAVLDTGVDSDHPDLLDDLAPGWYHFLDQGGDAGDGAEDDHGHGTHVSGIITSSGTNAPIGVAPDADILAIKVLDSSGYGWISDIAMGIDYVVSHKDDYDNLNVINMSLGTETPYKQCPCDDVDAETTILSQSVQAAKSAGIVVIAASGNNYSTTAMASPACLSDVVAVAAVYDESSDRADQITYFSNRSACNDLAAPGSGIRSTKMGGGATTLSGTSMAAPHVAGTVALMGEKAVDFFLTPDPDQLIQIMKDTGYPTDDPADTTPNPIRVDAYDDLDGLVTALNPVAGTYAMSSTPDINYGSDSVLSIGPESDTIAYLRFDLSSIPSGATVNKAELRIFCESVGGSGSVTIANIEDAYCWTESDLNWSNRPEAEITGITSIPTGPDQWWGIDVTELATKWIEDGLRNRGVAIFMTDSGNLVIQSKAGEHKPELLVATTMGDGQLAWPVGCDIDCETCRIAYFPDIDNDGQSFDCSVNHSPEETHGGTDIAAPLGTDVLAAADGEVLWVFDNDPENEVCTSYGDHCQDGIDNCSCSWCFNEGNVIVIKHAGHGVPSVFATSYGHLGQIVVTAGQFVSKGEKIGEVGNSGNAAEPHLHFEVWGSTFQDPVDPWAGECGRGQSLWANQPDYKPGCQMVDFPDSNLEAVIRQVFNIPWGEIYDTDLNNEEPTALSAASNSIANLEGMQYCTKLATIDLSDNLFSTIDTLSGLPDLEMLDLSDNQISDIDALVSNSGIDSGDAIELIDNPLTCTALLKHIPVLSSRGVQVDWSDDGITDHDGDGLPDVDEDRNGDGVVDPDEPDPCLPDTDSDQLNDGDEYTYWGENWNADIDGDGLINLVDPDADGDGFLDGYEITFGFDPSDPGSHPPPASVPATGGSGMIGTLLLVYGLGVYSTKLKRS